MLPFRRSIQFRFVAWCFAACIACWLATSFAAATFGQEAEKTKEKETATQPEKPSAESAKPAPGTPAGEAKEVHSADAKAADAHAAETKAAEHPATEAHGGAHVGGGHHDESDLSHQNATAMLEDPSEWKSDLAIWSLVVFLGLLLLLSKFAWGPVMEGLEKRERAIAANIDEAKRSADKAAEQLRQYEARLAAATDEARTIIGQARKDADTAREHILAEAQSAAQRERQRAIDDINLAKKAALQEMTEKSIDMAVAIAGQLVRKQLNRDDQARLIRETLEKFPSNN